MSLFGEAAAVLLLGALILLVAWTPSRLERVPLSVPMLCLAIGAGLGVAYAGRVDVPALRRSEGIREWAEAVLLISLTGAGLKIDRPFGLRRWRLGWRLLLVGMPLTIASMAALGLAAGYPFPTALLLGAALAPTDPVLASEVQVGPPRSGPSGDARFGLTVEAALNDGLAFPFVSLAILLASGGPPEASWLGFHFLGKPLLGMGVGVLLGRGFGWLMLGRRGPARVPATSAGLVALGVALIAYGTADLARANGFVAVFCTAVAFRASCPDAEFHSAMTWFSGQVERLMVMVLIVLLGMAIGAGGLQGLTWADVALAAALFFVLRPLWGAVSLIGLSTPWRERAVMAFFGIRGVGALFYGLYAARQAGFEVSPRAWSLLGFTVAASILLHGALATPAMRWLERAARRRAAGQGRPCRE